MESLAPQDDRPHREDEPPEDARDVSHAVSISDPRDVGDGVSDNATDDPSGDVSRADAGTHEPAYPRADGPEVPTAPSTGDAVVDAAMIELAAAEAGSLAERIDAGERAHRVLQGRLSDLGGA